jgi:protein phosphatase
VTTILVDDPALIVLIGPAGAGKSTFAARHFEAADVLSSDDFRAMLSGDPADQRRTRTAFSLLHREVVRRLGAGKLVVVDATNVEAHARRALIALARAAGVPTIAIVLDLPSAVVHVRNASRTGRVVPTEIVERHIERLAASLSNGAVAGEGFAAVHILRSGADLDAAVVVRRRAPGA